MRYFEIVDSLGTGFAPLVERFQSVRRPGGCKTCSTLPKSAGPPDILRVKAKSSDTGIVSFTSWGFGIIAVELLDFLGAEATRCLRVGRLADSTGELIPDFRTFVGVERIILRGDVQSEHRICQSCGALVYTYLPRTAPYVTAPTVAKGMPIFEIESMRLLVSEIVRDRIGSRFAAAIAFDEVEVATSPRDGLPVELDLWPIAGQLSHYKPNPPKWRRSE
jgi:hypothetical protein